MQNNLPKIKVKFLEQQFCIAKLRHLSSSIITSLIKENAIFFVSQACSELSIICEERFIDNPIAKESHWMALKIDGAISFDCIGVLNSLLTPLADAKISILAMSTFDTDYVFFKTEKIAEVKIALIQHCVFID